ncbi:hypothetical protein GGE65_005918 [Skermanella aerolata]|uniref:hypothetical protein n=1 Tax=Skermanella aerolata TaxID=393310 RepID=UPI003D1C18CE
MAQIRVPEKWLLRTKANGVKGLPRLQGVVDTFQTNYMTDLSANRPKSGCASAMLSFCTKKENKIFKAPQKHLLPVPMKALVLYYYKQST